MTKKEIKEKITIINNELQMIYVRGIDSIHMASALTLLESMYKDLDKKEEVKSEISDSE